MNVNLKKYLLKYQLDQSAHEAATSPQNTLSEPTDGQKSAGNYKVGRMKLSGLNISIENPVGSLRNGQTMSAHYGYVRGSGEQADGDLLDVFVKPGTLSDWDGTIFVIEQADDDGSHDEYKVMIGYHDVMMARRAYLAHYPPGQQKKIIGVQAMSLDEFKAWMMPAKKSLIHRMLKYNENHDELGRFSTADGASFVSTGNTKAVERQKTAYAELKAKQSASRQSKLPPKDANYKPLNEKERNDIARSNTLYDKYGSKKEGGRGEFKAAARAGELDQLHGEHLAHEKQIEDAQNKAQKEKNQAWKDKNLPRLVREKAAREEREINRVREFKNAQAKEAEYKVALKERMKAPDAKQTTIVPESGRLKPEQNASHGYPTRGRISADDPSIYGSHLLGYEGELWSRVTHPTTTHK